MENLSMEFRIKINAFLKLFTRSLLSVIVLSCTAAGGTRNREKNGKEIPLVRNGHTAYTIVIGENAGKLDKMAADELKNYLEKISGADFEIKKDNEIKNNKKLILIGSPAKNRISRSLGVKIPSDMKVSDAFIVKQVASNIVIAGYNDLGTLFGVYAFLEYLGVRWFMPGEIGEVVPIQKNITLKNMNLAEKPDFRFRDIGCNMWSVRNKLSTRIPIDGGIKFKWAGHTFGRLIPVDEYFDSHPEWYALVDGKRRRYEGFSTQKNQLCTSNQELIKETVRKIRKIFDEDPDIDIISLDPNDHTKFCECSECKKLDEKGTPSVEDVNSNRADKNTPGARRVLSRRLLTFYNQVAAEIHKSHPDKIIKSFAYAYYLAPPEDKNIRAEKNLMIQLCHGVCHKHNITDEKCPYNRAFDSYLRGWSNICEHIMIYEYYKKSGWMEFHWPIIHSIRKDIPYYKDMGVDGFYTQYSPCNVGTLGLNYYIAAKLLWNSNADVDELLNDFYDKFYGKAAAPMKKYFENFEAAMKESKVCPFGETFYVYSDLLKVFTDERMKKAASHLKEAEALAETPMIKERVNMSRISFDYMRMALYYLKELQRLRNSADDPKDIQIPKNKMKRLVSEIKEYLKKHKDKNVFRINAKHVQKRLLKPNHVVKNMTKEKLSN